MAVFFSRRVRRSVTGLWALLITGVALPASARPPLRFCEEATQCRRGEACVAGTCISLKDARVTPLFPLAVDRIADRRAGRGRPGLAQQVEGMARRMLTVSGFFKMLDPARRPHGAPFETLAETTIDAQAWYDAGAYAVVKGQIEGGHGQPLRLRLALFLVEEARFVPVEPHVQTVDLSEPRALRAAVAHWVDALITHFTGKGGVFDTRIAFAYRPKRGAPKEIGVMDMDGGGERAVTHNGSINMLPAFTADGHIAYTSFRAHNPDLWLDGKKLSSHPRMNSGVAFYKDKRRMALTLSKDGNSEIYIADARTGATRRRVTHHPAIDTSPTWSPDGRRLGFVSDRGTGRPQIYVVSSRGGEVQRLPQVGTYNSSPDWSPTGREIAYSAMMGNDRYDIFAIDVDAGTVRRLTDAGSNEEPSYSRDGRYIAYTSTRGGQQAIWIMTADGTGAVKVSRRPGIYMTPAWER